jgi:hypothetical protein
MAVANVSIVDCRVIRRRLRASRPDSSTSAHPNHLGLIRIINIRSTLLRIDTSHGWRFSATWNCHRNLESLWQRRYYRFRRGGWRYTRSFQILLGFFFFWLDGKWLGRSLRMCEKQRLAFRETLLRTGVQLKGWEPSRVGMYLVVGELVALTVTAWSVYILYALGK